MTTAVSRVPIVTQLPPAGPLIPLWTEAPLEEIIRLLEGATPPVVLHEHADGVTTTSVAASEA